MTDATTTTFAWSELQAAPRPLADTERRRWPQLMMPVTAVGLLIALPVGGVIALIRHRTPKPEPAKTVELRPGERTRLTGGMIFTFWKDNVQPPFVGPAAEYFLVDPADEHLLTANQVAAAPPGCRVRPGHAAVALKDAAFSMRFGNGVIKNEHTYKYRQYEIDGAWEVEITDACPPGDHTITIQFANVSGLRERFGAKHPRSDTVTLHFRRI